MWIIHMRLSSWFKVSLHCGDECDVINNSFLTTRTESEHTQLGLAENNISSDLFVQKSGLVSEKL